MGATRRTLAPHGAGPSTGPVAVRLAMGCFVLLLAVLLATCHVDRLIAPSTADIRLTVAADTVGIADTARLVAIVTVDGKQNRALRVQWTTSAVDTATVDSSGVVRGIRRGTATITARVENELFLPAPLTASAAIRVVVPRILLAPADTTFTSVGDTICLRATALDAAGGIIAGFTPTYTVTVDPDSTVTPDGPAGCFRARRSGVTATVRAALDTAQKTATLPVRPIAVSLNVTPDSVRFNSLTAQRSLTAAAVDRRGNPITSPALVWTPRDTIVSVNAGGVVTARANGTTWVRAADTAGTARDSARVVVQQVAATIAVSPGSDTLRMVRGRATLSATVRDSLSKPIGAASPVWTSLAPDSVRVAGYGGASATVEAVAEGNATIVAQDTVGSQVLTGTARLTVRYQLASLQVSPPAATLLTLGDTVRFTATGRDANDSLVSQPRVVWRAADTTRVRIDSVTGLATARNAGTTNVIARRDAVADTAAASVTPPVLNVDTTAFVDSLLRSSSDSVSVIRTVGNVGAGILGARLTIVHGASWLTVIPDTVTIPAGNSTSIRVAARAGSLAEGTYVDTVRVRAGGAASSPKDMRVQFRVFCPLSAVAPDTSLAAGLTTTDCGARHQAGSFADYYRFTGVAGDSLRIAMTTSPTSLDTYLYLLDGAGAVVASNDNCPGAGLNSCLTFTVPVNGPYTIEATSFTSGTAFAYTLALTHPQTPTAATGLGQFAGGTPIPAGDSANTSTIEFRATGHDLNPRDTLRLQVEVRPLGQAFSNTPSVTGTPTPNAGSGVPLSAPVSGLVNATEYHWQARVMDQTGRAGPWTAFGGGVTRDFKVVITTPQLTVTPPTLSDAAPAGSIALRQSTIQITNTGNGTFTWHAATDSLAWVGLSPDSGAPGTPLTISLNPAGKSAGTYQATVTITAPGALGSPATIPVTLEIQQAVLVVTPDSVSRSTNAGSGQTFQSTLRIANSGNGSLSWTASHNPAKTWLSFTRTTGGAPDSIPLTIYSAGLGAGVYRDTIVVNAGTATGSPRSIPVTLTVYQPVLVVTPTPILDSANAGDTVPRSHVLHVSNGDGGTMTWNAVKTAPWVALAPGGDSVVVTLLPKGLAGGLHRDTVVFTSPEAINDPVKVPVALDILQPILSVTPATIADSAVQLQTAPRVHTLTIANAGRGRLTWSALDDTTWISVSPAGDTIPRSLTVTLTPTGLAVGTHVGKVVVTSLNATGSPDTIPVTFKITPPPLLSVSPTSYTDSAFQGSALAKSFVLHIANTGPGTLAWGAVSNSPSWLALSKASGGAPPTDSTVVTLTPGSLATGTYNGTVTVTATGAAGSPATVPVSFVIQPCLQPAVIPDTVISSSVTLSDCGAPLRAGSVAKLYSVNANAGDTLSFRLTAGFNAYLVLTDSLGNSLRQNDECSPEVGTACIKDYPVTVTGRYVTEATTSVAGATGAFTLSAVRERRPSLPQSIGQFRADSTTAIGIGLTTPQNVAVFKGTLSDPNLRDSLRLEIEMILTSSPFSGSPTHQSGYVAVGQTAWIRVSALTENAGYHWQARTCDKTLRCSAWVGFGNPDPAADFFVNAILETPAAPTNIGQFTANGTTPIPLGGTAGSSSVTVVFKGLVTDPDPGDLISLEVEVKETTTTGPDGTGLRRGTGVVTNGTASVAVAGLTGAVLVGTNYYWRARACDQTNGCSAWVDFGNNGNVSGGLLSPAGTDFHVNP